MVASVQIREKNGAGEVATDKTSSTVRFKTADDSNVDLNNPMIIPASGQNHSVEKWLRLYIDSPGPDTQITNLRAYLDGTNNFGAGVDLYYATASSYSTPTTPSNSDSIPKHGGVAMTDAFTLTSGSPLNLGAGPYSGTTKDIGDYLILVLTVRDNASPGVTPTETFTFSYDEI